MWSIKCRFWTPESSLSFIWGHFCRGHRGRPLLRAFTIQSSLTVAVSWCCIKKKSLNCVSHVLSCFLLFFQAYAQFAGAPLKLRKISNPWRSPSGEAAALQTHEEETLTCWKRLLIFVFLSSGSLPALRTNQKETLSRPSDIIIHLRKQVKPRSQGYGPTEETNVFNIQMFCWTLENEIITLRTDGKQKQSCEE